MVKSVKRTVSNKLGKGLSKLNKSADWVGAIGGYFGTVATAANSMGSDFMQGTIDLHLNAVTRHNIGAVMDTPARMGDPNWNPMLLTGAIAAVGGWIVKMLPNFVPHQDTIGNIVSKAGVGAVIGATGAIVVSELAQGSSPFDRSGTKSGTSQGSASTAGRIPNPRLIKSQASYPADGRKTWSRPLN